MAAAIGDGGAVAAGEHIGLDLGTSRIVLASQRGAKTEFAEELNAFITLPYQKMTAAMLEREEIHHFVSDGQIYAFGNRVDEFANIVGGTTRRPMQTGLLNPDEPRSLEITEALLSLLLGKAKKGQKLCYSIPAAPGESERRLVYHREEVGRMLREIGFEVSHLNEGMAVIYADLKDTEFTGIGISFGGGMCNICLGFRGLPVLEFATGRAGDYIDAGAAGATGETPATVRHHKETEYKIASRANAIDRALSIYYDLVIEEVVSTIERQIAASKSLPRFGKKLRVVCAGGTAAVEGFVPAFRKALLQRSLPLELGEVGLSADPLNATAKGVLVSAMVNM
jgi:hypothetical protein